MFRINVYCLLYLWLSVGSNLVAGNEITNVLLLLADDAGFEMGAYLNKYCQTPNLDALARRGLLFNNAFTSASSCSPSRAQLLTGESSHTNGMYGLHQGVNNFNVLPDVQALPNVLKAKANGRIFTGIIGKKHVGPKSNFMFDFEETEEQHSINQIGRNITNMKMFARKFFTKVQQLGKQFFLMVGFHDPHRCGHITPQYGEFCERWGSGEEGMGSIPDWKPIYYDWRNLQVTQQMPDTDVVRKELAAQYMTISRLDQGVGLILAELKAFGYHSNTLVIYTSDNGPPFLGGRTNLYDFGIRSPFILASPIAEDRHSETTATMTSLMDVYSTILDAFHLYEQNSTQNIYTKSLMPLLKQEPPKPVEDDAVFGSQNYHEITMNYPMRMIRTKHYKLLHNLNYWAYFPIDKDFYTSPTFQEFLNATQQHVHYPYYRTLSSYYRRPEWELYDLRKDPLEFFNQATNPKFQNIFKTLQQRLYKWQLDTKDPWLCAPHAVLQDQGIYKNQPKCLSLGHELIKQQDKYHYEIIKK